MTDAMSMQRQSDHVASRFAEALGVNAGRVNVEFTFTEEIVVHLDPESSNDTERFWVMEIGSDDDRYRFELWQNGCDTGIYVEFAFEGETL